jgi:hypothetical protein
MTLGVVDPNRQRIQRIAVDDVEPVLPVMNVLRRAF